MTTFAADGDVAVQRYREQSYDVVIMDLAMPVKNGIRAMQEILAEFPSAKIVAISGVDPEQLESAVAKVREQKPESRKTGQLVTVFGSVGGVGATTIAANLAVELKQLSPGKVAVIDLDFRSSSSHASKRGASVGAAS